MSARHKHKDKALPPLREAKQAVCAFYFVLARPDIDLASIIDEIWPREAAYDGHVREWRFLEALDGAAMLLDRADRGVDIRATLNAVGL